MSSNTSNTSPTIAFFGSTGGCTLAALIQSLKAGYACRCLVRTPAKLSALLNPPNSNPSNAPVPTENLTIIPGSIDDPSAVSSTIKGATIIIFGIGGAPAFSWNPLNCFVTLNDPTICERGIKAVLAVLDSASPKDGSGPQPLICCISSTGLKESGQRDLPTAMRPLYRLLKVPHEDKKKMEAAVRGSGREFVVVRPALLTDGQEAGRVRAGYEGGEEGEAVGYTVSRRDVGEWIFREVVEGRGGEWRGRGVSLAY